MGASGRAWRSAQLPRAPRGCGSTCALAPAAEERAGAGWDGKVSTDVSREAIDQSGGGWAGVGRGGRARARAGAGRGAYRFHARVRPARRLDAVAGWQLEGLAHDHELEGRIVDLPCPPAAGSDVIGARAVRLDAVRRRERQGRRRPLRRLQCHHGDAGQPDWSRVRPRGWYSTGAFSRRLGTELDEKGHLSR